MKTSIFFLVALCTINIAHAQTLFTYGTHTVSKDEFLQAFNKNPDTTGNRQHELKEYLDLYINFRLKLQAAYDEKADTNADLKVETANFKAQLTENYINQQADINQLLHEAFVRSQKDILLQQVFVSSPAGSDTTAAYTEISKAYSELKAGKNFEDVSVEYSNTESVKKVKGNIGYITAFTLPYLIESLVYNLKAGDFSNIYKSKAGYHIFKNAGERAAAGRRKFEQLLFNIPPFYTSQQTDSVKNVTDSVYHLLQTGTSFASLAPLYSQNYNDYENASTIEIKVGDYSNDFEKEVFNLKTPGEFSKPFKTEYGYNIVKLNEILPVPSDENDINFASYLQIQIQSDGRLDLAKKNLVEEWLGITGFKEVQYNKPDLWIYTDSSLKNAEQLPVLYKGIKPSTVLFGFSKKQITVADWINYLQSIELPEDQTNKAYEKQMQDYIRFACENYYRENIEDFNKTTSEQIKEFSEANLLFYVMDKHVWSKASEDTVGLKKYYETHKNAYAWQKSLSAIIISAPGKELIDSLAIRIKNAPADWRSIVAVYNNTVYADSSRFEVGELPVRQPVLLEKDFQTAPENNESGDSYTFIHVLQVYTQPQQKSFEEAKGIVINDYQQVLEQTWINDLKKAYPVQIDQAVLGAL